MIRKGKGLRNKGKGKTVLLTNVNRNAVQSRIHVLLINGIQMLLIPIVIDLFDAMLINVLRKQNAVWEMKDVVLKTNAKQF